MEFWFYHLQRQPLAAVLPVLAAKALERGWRVVVQLVDDAQLRALDDALWTWRDESFLPHGAATEPRAARHPLVLTTGPDNINDAAVRMYAGGAAIDLEPAAAPYQRAMLLFDGRDDAELDDARRQWSRLKAAGFVLAYWQQDDAGRWERKMQSRPADGAGSA